jgi:hypothetical protein
MPRRKAVKKAPMKLSKAQMIKLMQGKGFFGDLWGNIKKVGSKIGDFAKDKLSKPSTYLGLAGMIPSPLAPALKVAGTVAGLAGKGKRKRHGKGKSSVVRF